MDFLMLYDKEKSFLWNDRERILDCIAHLKCINLSSPFYNSEVLDKFIEYRDFKEEESKNMANESVDLISLQVNLDNNANEPEDAFQYAI